MSEEIKIPALGESVSEATIAKWHKKEENDKIDAIMEYYNVNYARAREIGNVLTDEQLTLIKIKLIKGGNNVQSQSIGGG